MWNRIHSRYNRLFYVLVILLVELITIIILTTRLQNYMEWRCVVNHKTEVQSEFREMNLTSIQPIDVRLQVENAFYQMRQQPWIKGIPFFDCFTYVTLENWMQTGDQKLLAKYRKLFELVVTDLRYFPVPKDATGKAEVAFENSWGSPRSYGGKRFHEGTDIMASNNKRGYFPVVSMCDGVVEKKGWLEQGGYRIGIRSASGLYIYYAHLCQYAARTEVGSKVKAGQVLGTMGDTGYGKKEGTKGKFDVHLHIGFYYNEGKKEISVNPYFILTRMYPKRFCFRTGSMN